jgi:hypothetical protein
MTKRLLILLSLLFIAFTNAPASSLADESPLPFLLSQNKVEDTSARDDVIKDDDVNGKKSPGVISPGNEPSPEIHKAIIRYTTLIGLPITTIIYGSNAWGWGQNHSWQWGSERWFKRSTDSGGADKVGHGYSHYVLQRIAYATFDYTENGAPSKWTYSLFTSITIGTMVEIGDAFSGHYGFSYEDLIADYIGIAIGAALDRYPVLDAFFGISAEYVPSEGLRKDPSKSYLDAASDYSGYKVMMNFKLGGFHYIGWDVPEFFRYIMFDAGYYTRGYTSQDRYIGKTEKKRYWFVGISINFVEVVKDLYKDKESRLCWLSQQPFKYYHVPVGYKYEKSIDE